MTLSFASRDKLRDSLTVFLRKTGFFETFISIAGLHIVLAHENEDVLRSISKGYFSSLHDVAKPDFTIYLVKINFHNYGSRQSVISKIVGLSSSMNCIYDSVQGSLIVELVDQHTFIVLYDIEDRRTIEPSFLHIPFGRIANVTGMSPIHAACLEINGNGLLIVGKGGSGKSTLAVDAISRGLRILGDDVLWVKVGNQTARAYATSKLLKLSNIDNSISKFFEMTGTTNDKGKQLFYVKPEFENQFLPEITLKFGITLNFSSTHNVERLEKQQFLQKLLPSTVTKFSDPGIGIRIAKNLADRITLNSISLVESRFSNIDSLIDVFG